MENNSDLNNQAAQYTLCFNTRCPKAENCLRHSMTQYTTAQNIRLSVINPSAIRRQGRSARTSAATRKYGWHGASRNFTMICPHASPVPFTSIWKPYSTIRPITGIATRSWGLLRSSRSASARYAGSMAGKRRYSSTGTPRNTTGKHFVGIPPQGSRHSTTGYLNYRQVVQGIPTVGSSCTTQWYAPYLSKVLLVPNCGTDSTKQRNLLVHAYN